VKAHLTESPTQDQNIYTTSAHLQQESLSGCQTPGKNLNCWLGGSGRYKAEREDCFLLIYWYTPLLSKRGDWKPSLLVVFFQIPHLAETVGQREGVPVRGPQRISFSPPARS